METPYPKLISPSQTCIGWIKIDVMGATMVSHLISVGYSFTIYACTPSKASSLQSHGAHLTNSLQELTHYCNTTPATAYFWHARSTLQLVKRLLVSRCSSFRGDIGAREGKLAIFARGKSLVVEWLKPLFDLIGIVTYMEEAGCGKSCKIGNQIMAGANLIGLSEGWP
ncbi:hypothetical protein REPUB_Repub01dG0172500 [Reevesia pubescens]